MTESENPIEEKKTTTTKFAEWLMARQEKKEATETFFLYVIFHSIWTSIFNFFSD